MTFTISNKPYSIILWVLFTLFCFRVSAQLIQFVSPVPFLPSFREWHSGTLSYSLLVFFQFVIIFFYLRACLRITSGKAIANKNTGKRLIILGSAYALIMIIRYILKMSLYPTERWFGGCLPIFFHMVLASFLITVGIFHVRKSGVVQRPGTFSSIAWGSIYTIIALLIPVWIAFQLMPTLLANEMGMRRPEYYVTDYKKVPVQMDDGAVLYADIYRPERLKSAPTILVRIPIDDNFKGNVMSNIVGRIWAERGYNVMIQGVRGRFNSEGKHIPFVNEREDGIATLRWLNKQPWHNGKTGMWGGSYFGYTQWVLSDQDSLGLKALFTHISSSSNYKMFYPGGTFAYESALFWATRSHSEKDTPMDYETLRKGYDNAPMVEADDRVIRDIPFYNDWVSHTTFDDYWKKVDGTERAKNLKVPASMMAGWYDPFLTSQVQDFEDVINHADKSVAKQCRLIIGPWAHAETVTMPNGYEDRNYRLASIAPSLQWYDQQLKGFSTNKLSPVHIFVMGINQWRYENSFPLERTNYTSWYLGMEPDSTEKESVNKLDTLPFINSGSQTFIFDPSRPLPSLGGSVLGARAGPKLQDTACNRRDLLRFDSDVLKENIEITGKVKLILYVSTDAKNTDFVAKLIDVYPDGKAYNISEGALRKSYKGKDQVEMVEIELNPTSNVFFKGHRIRLEVSSSSYPGFSLNYNTGGNNFEERKGVVAEQKVYTGAVFRSQLILPVIPPEKE